MIASLAHRFWRETHSPVVLGHQRSSYTHYWAKTGKYIWQYSENATLKTVLPRPQTTTYSYETTCLIESRAARFINSNNWFDDWKLRWVSLKKRRRASRLMLLYKGLKSAVSIPTDDCIPLTPTPIPRPPPPPTPPPPGQLGAVGHHSLTFRAPTARIYIYKDSFFLQLEFEILFSFEYFLRWRCRG